MDHLRSSVGLRAYGQRDPLIEYRREGLKFFKEMEATIAADIAKLLPNLGGGFAAEEVEIKEVHSQASVFGQQAAAQDSVAATKPAVGRNDPCPCGSGKKYKKCHGR
jgi:preprotein translocase subunit SecA